MFRGSQAYPQGVKMLLDAGWKRVQSYNAVTNADTTTYMFSPPKGAKDLAFTLNVLDQMMFHAHLSQKDLDDELKIIPEEWCSGKVWGRVWQPSARRVFVLIHVMHAGRSSARRKA